MAEEGVFPLHDACRKGDQKVVRYLISSGDYDPNCRDELDRTPLHCACEGSLDTVRFLCEEAQCNHNCLDYFSWTPLHFACQAGELDIVKYLVEKHGDVNCTDNYGSTPLHVACKGGHLDVVRYLVRSPQCSVSARDEGGNTPMHICCHYGHLEVVKFLVQGLHCDVKVRNNTGDTPAHVAYRNRHTHVTSFLLQYRYQESHIPDDKEASALYYACQHGDLDSVVSLLIDQLVDVCSARITPSWDTALHIACLFGHLNIVSFLLNQVQCDAECKNSNGATPLHVACNQGRMDIVGFLNEWCIQHNVGISPLHIACRLGQTDLVQFLVCQQPFTTEYQDEFGDTPLHVACHEGYVGIVRLLNANGNSINCCNKQGDTPLHVAIKCRYPLIADILLDETCQVNCRNEYGNTPLHISCQQGQLGVVVNLVLDRRCETNSQNKNKDTPLHIAVNCSHSDIVRFLVKQTECDLNCQNKDGNTALHIAAATGQLRVLTLLVQDIHCKINLQNGIGNTPLHIACQSGRMEIVEYLITNNEQGCEFYCQITSRTTPILIAFKHKHYEIANLLVKHPRCDINCHNVIMGYTPLHYACEIGWLDVVKLLIQDRHCNVNCQNTRGNTPLHIACEHKLCDIATLLSSHCDGSIQNKDGDSPLHIACRQGDNATVKMLIQDRHCDVNCQNTRGNTPLHIACEHIHCDIATLLSSHCAGSIQNKDGDSPLHIACRQGDNATVKMLIQDRHCNVNCQNTRGNTPLHIACEHKYCDIATVLSSHCDGSIRNKDGDSPLHIACRQGDSATVKILLCTCNGKIDPECVNNLGYTPAELTNEYKIIQMLSSVQSHSLQAYMYVKLFVIGNSGVGKSTLIEALCKEIPKWKRIYFVGSWNMVTDVELHTAGIIPRTFHSNQFGNTVVYDFAGQYEYYSSHGAVIKKLVLSSPPLFLLVVDLREDDYMIIEKLNFWGSFITNHSLQSSDPPHVIVIASYADAIQANGESPRDKLSRILQSPTLRFASVSTFHFTGSIVTDCRKLISQELDELRSLLTESCITLRSITDIDFRCHVLNTFLLEQFQDTVACTVGDISARVTQEDALLPSSAEQLLHVLSTLSDKGYSLLIKDSISPEKSWVVLEKTCLLADINGTIFAPEHFRQHRAFSQSTGVVPLSKMREVFQEHNPEMIVGFLTQLEFCIEIDDQEALDNITFSGIPYDPAEKYYFFPALVNVENPQDVCCSSHPVQNKCGWYLKCIMHDEFLTTRFLHVLVLRLAFSFALAPEHGSDPTSPVLTRRCSVWKHGIAWWNRDGIETIVEVGLQCQWVAVMVRSPTDMVVECSQLRSSLIQTVLKAKSEFCRAVKVSEAFIHPDFIQYPFSESEGCVLYSFNEIKTTITERKTYAVDRTGKHPIKTEDLLHFEPYAGLTSSVINQLFNPENAEIEVTDKFLAEFAAPEEVYTKKELFRAMIKPDSVMLHERYSRAPNDPVRQFIYLLQCLRDRCVTFKHFREELDKHSIFSGGNPLEDQTVGLPQQSSSLQQQQQQ